MTFPAALVIHVNAGNFIRGEPSLDAIESAIRKALEKGDASDRAFRETVYRSIFAALDKASAANSEVSPEAAAKRRQALAIKVREVEASFMRAEHNITEPVVDPEPSIAPSREVAPDDERSDNPPAVSTETEIRVDDDSESPPVFSKKRRPYAWMLSAAILFAAVGMGGWWIYQSDILTPASERDSSVPNPPRTLESEDFQPSGSESPALREEAEVQRQWITIFSPDDPSTVVATVGANVEVTEDGDDKALKVRSSSRDAAAMFDIGEGVLEQIAGGKAVFNVVAVSDEGSPTEFSIRCNFGDLGDCKRHRFSASATIADYLFEVELPDGSPGAAGTIALVSDVSGEGLAVNIREIKVSPSR